MDRRLALSRRNDAEGRSLYAPLSAIMPASCGRACGRRSRGRFPPRNQGTCTTEHTSRRVATRFLLSISAVLGLLLHVSAMPAITGWMLIRGTWPIRDRTCRGPPVNEDDDYRSVSVTTSWRCPAAGCGPSSAAPQEKPEYPRIVRHRYPRAHELGSVELIVASVEAGPGCVVRQPARQCIGNLAYASDAASACRARLIARMMPGSAR
jgi:hypothetical protein